MSAPLILIIVLIVTVTVGGLVYLLVHTNKKTSPSPIVPIPPPIIPTPTSPALVRPIHIADNITLQPVLIFPRAQGAKPLSRNFQAHLDRSGYVAVARGGQGESHVTMSFDSTLIANTSDSIVSFYVSFMDLISDDFSPIPNDALFIVPSTTGNVRMNVSTTGKISIRPIDGDFFAAGSSIMLRSFSVSWKKMSYM